MDAPTSTGTAPQPEPIKPWKQVAEESNIFSLPAEQRVAEYDKWSQQAIAKGIRDGDFDEPDTFSQFKLLDIRTRKNLASDDIVGPSDEDILADYNSFSTAFQDTQKAFASQKPTPEDNAIQGEVLQGKRNAAFVRGQMVFNPTIVNDPQKYREAILESDAPPDIKMLYAGLRPEMEKSATVTRRRELASSVITRDVADKVVNAIQEGTEVFGADIGTPQSPALKKNKEGVWSVVDPEYVDMESSMLEAANARYNPLADAQYKPLAAINEYQKKYGLSDEQVQQDYMEALIENAPTAVNRWVSKATSVEEYVKQLDSTVRVKNKDVAPEVRVQDPNLFFDAEGYNAAVDKANAPDEAKNLAKEARTQFADAVAGDIYNNLLANRDDFREDYAKDVVKREDMAKAITRYYKDKKDQAWYDDVGEFIGQTRTALEQGGMNVIMTPSAILGMFGSVKDAEDVRYATMVQNGQMQAEEAVANRTGGAGAIKLTGDVARILPDLAVQMVIGIMSGGALSFSQAAAFSARTGLSKAAARTAIRQAMVTGEKAALKTELAKLIPNLSAQAADDVATGALEVAARTMSNNPLKGGIGTQRAIGSAYAGLTSAGSTFGQVYTEVRAMGKSPEESIGIARTAGITAGAITGALTHTFGVLGRGGVEDFASMGRKAGEFTVRDIVKSGVRDVLTTQEGRQLARSIASGIAKDSLHEGVEEGLDQTLNLISQYATNPSPEAQNRKVSDVINEALYAGLLGFIAGGGSNVVGQARATAPGITAQQMQAEILGADATVAPSVAPPENVAPSVAPAPEPTPAPAPAAQSADPIVQQAAETAKAITDVPDTSQTAAALEALAKAAEAGLPKPEFNLPIIEKAPEPVAPTEPAESVNTEEAPAEQTAEPAIVESTTEQPTEEMKTTEEMQTARDATKPEQMTPEKGDEVFVKGGDDRITRRIDNIFTAEGKQMVLLQGLQDPIPLDEVVVDPKSDYRKRKQRKAEQTARMVAANPQLIRQLGDLAVRDKQPVGQDYINAIGGGIPKGYVKEGELYVFKGEEAPAAEALVEKPVKAKQPKPTKPDAVQKPKPDEGVLRQERPEVGLPEVDQRGRGAEQESAKQAEEVKADPVGYGNALIGMFPALKVAGVKAITPEEAMASLDAEWKTKLDSGKATRLEQLFYNKNKSNIQELINGNSTLGGMWIKTNKTVVIGKTGKPSVMAHEIGHAIMELEYENAPKKTKDAIVDEYWNWFGEKYGQSGTPTVADQRRIWEWMTDEDWMNPSAPSRQRDSSWERYRSEFSEWFADEVAKWAATKEEPRSLIEKFFSELAAKLTRLWDAVRGNFSPSETLSSWLDSISQPSPAKVETAKQEQKPEVPPEQQDVVVFMDEQNDEIEERQKPKKKRITPGEARKAGIAKQIGKLGIQSNDPDSVIAALKKIAAKPPQPHHARIAKDLLSVLEGSGTSIVLVASNDLRIKKGDERVNGWYDPQTNAAYINLDGPHELGIEETILHELVHASGEKVIRNPQTDAQKRILGDLQKQMEAATKNAISLGQSVLKTKETDLEKLIALAASKNNYALFDILYGVSSLSEYHAHATTSKAFQRFLSEYKEGSKRNFFERFVNSITSLLSGKKTTEGSDAEKSYATLLDLMRENKGDVRLSNTDAVQSRARGRFDLVDAVRAASSGDASTPFQALNEAINANTELTRRIQAESERRSRAYARGKGAILEQIIRAGNTGRLPQESIKPLTDFVNSVSAEALADTRISLSARPQNSTFDFTDSLVTLALNGLGSDPNEIDRTGVHEFWHGLSRFIPDDEIEKMRVDYVAAVKEYISENPWFVPFIGRTHLSETQYDELSRLLSKDEMDAIPWKSWETLDDGRRIRGIKWSRENYRLFRLDEWVAETMADLVRRKQERPTTILGKMARLFRDFIDTLKQALGNPYLRALDAMTMPDEAFDAVIQRYGPIEDNPPVMYGGPAVGVNNQFVLGMYAGEKALENLPEEARAFKRDSLEAARAMAAAGKTSEEIRAVTGWFPGKYDGKMRWEIPDNEAKVKRAKVDELGEVDMPRMMKSALSGVLTDDDFIKVANLEDVLDHEALFEAYPDARKIGFGFQLEFGGTFFPEKNLITADYNSVIKNPDTLLHEIQHWIQETEGFPKGSSPDMLADQYPPKTQKAAMEWLVAQGVSPEEDYGYADENDYVKLAKRKGWGGPAFLVKPMAAYMRTSGEIEARDVEARRSLAADQRAAIAPYSSENIAPDEAIVRYSKARGVSTEQDAEYLAAVNRGDEAGAQKFVDSIIPEIPQGMTRLWRSDAMETGTPIPSWMESTEELQGIKGASGRWFYKTKKEAEKHLKDFEGSALSFVDVPSDVVESYNAKDNPFAGGYGKQGFEYFVPRQVAERRISTAPVVLDGAGNVVPLSKRLLPITAAPPQSKARGIVSDAVVKFAPQFNVVDAPDGPSVEFDGRSVTVNPEKLANLEEYEVQDLANRAVVAAIATPKDPIAAGIIQQTMDVAAYNFDSESRKGIRKSLADAHRTAHEFGMAPLAMELGNRLFEFGGATDADVRKSMARGIPSDEEYADAYKRGDTEAAQGMVDGAAKALGMRKAYHSGAERMEGDTIRTPFFYMTEQRRDAASHNSGQVTEWYVLLRNPIYLDEHQDQFMDFRLSGFADDTEEVQITKGALEYMRELIEEGYDGIIMPSELDEPAAFVGPHGSNYIAFSPEQIKSADPFTFDDAGELIPLSQRFNPASQDIRFSRARGVESNSAHAELERRFRAGDKDAELEAKALVEEIAKQAGWTEKAYHGTPGGGFTVFDIYGSRYGLMGQGAYFTDARDIARSYADKQKRNVNPSSQTPMVYEVFLKPGRVLDMEAPVDTQFWLDAFGDYLTEDSLSDAKTNENAFRALEEALKDEGVSMSEGSEIVSDGLMSRFDSVKHIGGKRMGGGENLHNVTIVFNSEQIKSADAFTYDDDGNLIPLSERFNAAIPDIRYSKARGIVSDAVVKFAPQFNVVDAPDGPSVEFDGRSVTVNPEKLANLEEYEVQDLANRAVVAAIATPKDPIAAGIIQQTMDVAAYNFDSESRKGIRKSLADAHRTAHEFGMAPLAMELGNRLFEFGGATDADVRKSMARGDAQQYDPRTSEEQAAFNKAASNKVIARNPQLAVAAVRMKNGEITAGEYADLVDLLDPFTPKGADPIPTNDKIYQYMSKTMGANPNTEEGRAKLKKIGEAIPSGKIVEFRIDIPTYNESTKAGDAVYSITAHEPVSETAKQVGKTISHFGVAKVTNPTFMTRAISGKGEAVTIAAGAGKFPLATVKGSYEPITDLPADINDPNAWTEVGYNPIRSSYFVDTRSKDAVVGGSEAIMVGSRVFVKDAKFEARPTGITMGERFSLARGVPSDEEYMAAVEAGDMEKAQRMVDDAAKRTKYTIGPVYHGGSFNMDTDPIFRVPKGHAKKNKWQMAFGVHFAELESEAKEYLKKDGKLVKAYIGGGLILDATQKSSGRLDQKIIGLFDPKTQARIKKRIEFLSSFGPVEDITGSTIPISVLADILDEMPPAQASKALMDAGFSGIAYTAKAITNIKQFRPFTAYIVVDSPNNIKSADAVTRDNDGNAIPLSQRFNPGSPDIRYSRARGTELVTRVSGPALAWKKFISGFRSRGMVSQETYDALRDSDAFKKENAAFVSFIAKDFTNVTNKLFGEGGANLENFRVFSRNATTGEATVSSRGFDTRDKAEAFAVTNRYKDYIVSTGQDLINQALGSNGPTLKEDVRDAIEKLTKKGLDDIAKSIEAYKEEYLDYWNLVVLETQADMIDPAQIATLRERKEQWMAALRLRSEEQKKLVDDARKKAVQAAIADAKNRIVQQQQFAKAYLPDELVHQVERAREKIDELSTRLTGINWLMEGSELQMVIEGLNGVYITRSYEAFETSDKAAYVAWLNEAYNALTNRDQVYDPIAMERIMPLVRHIKNGIMERRIEDLKKENDQRQVDAIMEDLMADSRQVTQVDRIPGQPIEGTEYEQLIRAVAKRDLLRRRSAEKVKFLADMFDYLARNGFASNIGDRRKRETAIRKEAKRLYSERYGDAEQQIIADMFGRPQGLQWAVMTDDEAHDIANVERALSESPNNVSGSKIWTSSISGTKHSSFYAAVNDDFQSNLDFITKAPTSKTGNTTATANDWRRLGDKILEHKNDVPAFLRTFLGEKDNPLLRVSDTILKQSHLIAVGELYRGIAEIGEKAGWLVHKEMQATDRDKYGTWGPLLSSKDADQGYENNPLKGMYADPVMAKAIDTLLAANQPSNSAFKVIAFVVGASLWNVTAGSVRAIARNLYSLPIFLMNSGILGAVINPTRWPIVAKNIVLASRIVQQSMEATGKVSGGQQITNKGFKLADKFWTGLLSVVAAQRPALYAMRGAASMAEIVGRIKEQPTGEAFQEIYLKAVRLGVANDNVQKEAIHRLLDIEEQAIRKPKDKNMGRFAKALKLEGAVGFGSYLLGTMKSTLQQRSQLYGAPDDFTKIMAWLNEMDTQANIHAKDDAQYKEWVGEDGLFSKMPDEFVKKAADNVTNLIQSHSRVWAHITQFKKLGFGALAAPFAAARAEFYRNAANAYIIAFEEMRSKNKKEQMNGGIRFASALMAHLAMGNAIGAVVKTVFSAFADDDEIVEGSPEYREAVRKLGPEYAKNKNATYILYKNGTFDWVDLSFANPFAFVWDSITAARRGATEKDVEDNIVVAMSKEILEENIGTFAKPQIALDAFAAIRTGYDPVRGVKIWDSQADSFTDKLEKSVSYYLKQAGAPGDYKDAMKIWKAAHGVEENGRQYKVGTEVGAVFLGTSIRTVNITDALEQKLAQAKDTLGTRITPLYKAPLRNANDVEMEDVALAVQQYAKAHDQAVSTMQKSYKAAETLLRETPNAKTLLRNVMSSDRVRMSQEVERAIVTGKPSFPSFSDQTLQKVKDLGKKHDDDRAKVMADTLKEYNQKKKNP